MAFPLRSRPLGPPPHATAFLTDPGHAPALDHGGDEAGARSSLWAGDLAPRRRDPGRALRPGRAQPPAGEPDDRRGKPPPGGDLLLEGRDVQALPPQPATPEARRRVARG